MAALLKFKEKNGMERISTDYFHRLYLNKDREVAKWKQDTKGKVLGCISPYTPEEIIHAAGMLPIEITGDIDNVTLADVYMPDYACSFTRGFLEKILRGDYNYLDSVVLTAFCDSILGMYNTCERVSKENIFYLLHYPSVLLDETYDYFLDELLRLRAFIENLGQKEVSDESLRQSIRIYNENRGLLRKLYDLRKTDNPPISGVESLEIVLSSMTTHKEHHNQMLKKLLRNMTEQKEPLTNTVRVLVSGNIIDQPDILRIIEETGAIIVSDDLDTGTRYFWNLVEESKKPLKAIAKRYLEVPSPFRHPFEDRTDYLMNMVKEFRVDGVIFLTGKFCDPYLFDYPYLEKALREEGFPTLSLEQEYPIARMAFKKRVEAFVEMLR